MNLVSQPSNLGIYASLFQDGISHDAGGYRHSNGKSVSAQGAEPYFVATLSLANQCAPVSQQQLAQRRIKAAPHNSKGDTVVGERLRKLKAQAQSLRGDVQAIFLRHFRGNLPNTINQSLIGRGLSGQYQAIANAHPEPALIVMNDLHIKGDVRCGPWLDWNDVHVRSLHLLIPKRYIEAPSGRKFSTAKNVINLATKGTP